MKRISRQEFANIFDCFLATDKNGIVFAYEREPLIKVKSNSWGFDGMEDCDFAEVTFFIHYEKGEDDSDWQRSIIRPNVKEVGSSG